MREPGNKSSRHIPGANTQTEAGQAISGRQTQIKGTDITAWLKAPPVASRFNILIPVDGTEDVLVFNTLKGTAALVSSDRAAFLKSGLSEACGERKMWRHYRENASAPLPVNDADTDNCLDAGLLAGDLPGPNEGALAKLGMLVESRFDDERAAQNLLTGLWHPKTLKLTLSYTAACQMDCSYCFQQGRDLLRHHDPSLMHSTVAFVEQYLDEHTDIAGIHLGLFGGEPLTNIDMAAEYIEKIRHLALQRSLAFNLSLTTNGLNLSADLISNWVPKGLGYLRVTLDGPPKIHNRRRPGHGGQPTFEKILANLKMLTGIKGFGIGISINIDSDNVDHVKDLLDLLSSAGLKEDVEIILELTLPSCSPRANAPAAVVGRPLPDMPEQGRLLSRALDQVIAAGFATPPFPGLCTPCNFVQSNNFVIDWSGNLFRCTFTMLDPALAVGSVVEGVGAKNEELLQARHATSACLERQCAYLPLCGGGCRFEAGLRTGDWAAENCPLLLWDEVLPRSIAHLFALKSVSSRETILQ